MTSYDVVKASSLKDYKKINSQEDMFRAHSFRIFFCYAYERQV
jgi:hypothetical protein